MCCVLFLKTYKKKTERRIESSKKPNSTGREGWTWLRSSALSSCVYSWVLNPQKQKAKSHPQDTTPIKWFIIARGFHGCFPSSGRKLTTKFHPGTSTKPLAFRFKTLARNSESIWIFFSTNPKVLCRFELKLVILRWIFATLTRGFAHLSFSFP